MLERYLNLKTLEREPLKLDVETSVDATKVAQFVEQMQRLYKRSEGC